MHRFRSPGALTATLVLALGATPALAQQQQFGSAPAPTASPPLSAPAPAPAPGAAPATAAAPTPATATLGPTYTAAQLGIHQDAAPTALNGDAFLPKRREGRALAIVGGAAVIAGLLIGGDGGTVIAIGGAGLGLYGLYVWLR